jgi:tetratricopeptide (TPR) repeat protein
VLDLNKALAWHPGNARAYRLLARLYRQSGDPIAEAEALAAYVRLRPKHPLGYYELAIACGRIPAPDLAQVQGLPCGVNAEGHRAALRRLWRKAGLSPADMVAAGQARVTATAEADSLEEAIDWYQRALAVEPGLATGWYGLGEAYAALDQADLAWNAYGKAANMATDAPVAAAAHARRAAILAENGRWREASAELALAIQLEPGEGAYHLNRGWYLIQEGERLEEARSELLEAARLMPGSPWPHLRLAHLENRAGHYQAMLARARHVIDLDASIFWGWIAHSEALRHLGRPAEAEDSARQAVKIAPNQPAAHFELGQVLEQTGLAEEAIQEYRRVLALDPDHRGASQALEALLR